MLGFPFPRTAGDSQPSKDTESSNPSGRNVSPDRTIESQLYEVVRQILRKVD